MDRKFLDLYGEYYNGLLDRREFIAELAIIAGGTAAAVSLLPLLESKYAMAAVIQEGDSRLQSEGISYEGETGDIKANLEIPKGDEKVPGVIVIHEVWGVTPYIRDVTRRLGVEGFMAIAPDAFTPIGGSPKDPQDAFQMIRKLDDEATIKNYMAAQKYLEDHPRSNGKVGVIGFCWGGSKANQLAVNSPSLKAAVPFYGGQPEAEDVPKIKASLLLHYAGDDERINAGIPAYEEALKKAGVDYGLYMYEGAQHAFHNDTSERYHEEAAKLAWKRTIEFLKEKLKT